MSCSEGSITLPARTSSKRCFIFKKCKPRRLVSLNRRSIALHLGTQEWINGKTKNVSQVGG